MATNFGETIKNLRKNNNITQAQLAQALSVGRPTIAGYETKGKQPDYEKLQKLAQFFNVSVDYLLNYAEKNYTPTEKSDIGTALEGKEPYEDEAYDLSKILSTLIQKLELEQSSLVYKNRPLNKATTIAIRNTICSLIDTIEEMNEL